MVLLAQRERWQGWRLELIGTDISAKIIAAARQGCFSQFEVQRGLTVAQMLGYFNQREEGWCPQDELRRMVTFREHNLLDRPPAEAPFDLVLLLDLSGSNSKKLKMIRNSAKRFVEATRPTDRVAGV